MPPWLALAATACFTLAALWLTIRAWQVRRTAPRTISLALSAAACVAVLVTAADLAIPLPHEYLCRHPILRNGDNLEISLERSFHSQWWRLSLCRRVQVHAETIDLENPIDFGKLAALATASGIAVDVSFDKTIKLPGDGLRLVHRPDPTTGSTDTFLAITTPIPASHTDEVYPEILGREGTRLQCRIGARTLPNPSLHEILRNPDEDTALHGYYRLVCWPAAEDEETAVSAYVHIAEDDIALQSDIELANVELLHSGHTASPFGAEQLTPIRETDGVPDQRLTSASMLILDRPRRPTSCTLAREALAVGKSVVVAMPEQPFIEACGPAFTILEGGADNTGKHPLFDREPRLTYVLDDFANDLTRKPTCVFQECDQTSYDKTYAEPLPPSLQVQLAEARSSCKRLAGKSLHTFDCNVKSRALATPSDTPIRIIDDPRQQDPRGRDRARLDRSSPKATQEPLVTAFKRSSPRVYRENELVVVFTHDGRDLSANMFTELLETASRMRVAVIRDPYGRSLSGLFNKTTDSPKDPTPSILVKHPGDRFTRTLSTCKDDRCVDLDALQTLEFPRQTKATSTVRKYGRFILADKIETEAPVRFLWWKPGPSAGLEAVDVAHTTDDGGLHERPLAVGMMVGRGHLLFLNYSPFERMTPVGNWKNAPGHAEILDGLRLIENLHENTAALRASAGPIHSVALRPDGAVWVTMNHRFGRDEHIPDLLRFDSTDSSIALDAPLVDFDEARGQRTYALPAHELTAKLLDGCVELHPVGTGSREPIQACPPGLVERSGRAMNAATSLRLLAHYTGGRGGTIQPDRDERPSDVLRTRNIGLVSLSLILLVAWSRRAARRLSGALIQRKLRRLEHIAQRRYDPPDAVVAAAGDWDGRSTTWPRTGAFGGYRPLEAGDRPSAIVLQDLVLPAQGGPQLLPRVVLRIEEAAPATLVLVNLGESMRIPGRGDHSKAAFASHVALHVAASAWKIRGEVAIDAVGVQGDVEIVAPVRLSPGYEELDVQVRARLGQPSTRDRAPWPDDLPECGSLVYVSDFQLEDTRALQVWVTRLEAEGIRVGGVMIYSPLEFTMIEGGRLAGSGVWADRTDWDPDDVFAAFSRRRDAIEHIFDTATTGGLVVAATHFSQDDVEVALESGRLLQILR